MQKEKNSLESCFHSYMIFNKVIHIPGSRILDNHRTAVVVVDSHKTVVGSHKMGEGKITHFLIIHQPILQETVIRNQ